MQTENPITQVRRQRGRSIRAFADDIGIHHQAILLAERGVYTTILPSIRKYLSEQDIDTEGFERQYQSFVCEKRSEEGSKMGVPTLTVAALGDPTRSPLVTVRNALGVSRMKFCKNLCIHPAYEFKCEMGEAGTLGEQIRSALSQAGCPVDVLKELETRQLDFKRD